MDWLRYGAIDMSHCKDTENLHLRIKRIIGQLQAIDRMIEDDEPCEDVIAQINAVKSAVHSCGLVVLEGHIHHCIRDGIEHGDTDKTLDDLSLAIKRFANL